MVSDVVKLVEERKFGFSTFPVVDDDDHLRGLFAMSDFERLHDAKMNLSGDARRV